MVAGLAILLIGFLVIVGLLTNMIVASGIIWLIYLLAGAAAVAGGYEIAWGKKR
jgi:hypothetical protein